MHKDYKMKTYLDYLKEQGVELPKEKADSKCKNLHERTYIDGFNQCRDFFLTALSKPLDVNKKKSEEMKEMDENKLINCIVYKLEGFELNCLREHTNDEMRQKRFTKTDTQSVELLIVKRNMQRNCRIILMCRMFQFEQVS